MKLGMNITPLGVTATFLVLIPALDNANTRTSWTSDETAI